MRTTTSMRPMPRETASISGVQTRMPTTMTRWPTRRTAAASTSAVRMNRPATLRHRPTPPMGPVPISQHHRGLRWRWHWTPTATGCAARTRLPVAFAGACLQPGRHRWRCGVRIHVYCGLYRPDGRQLRRDGHAARWQLPVPRLHGRRSGQLLPRRQRG